MKKQYLSPHIDLLTLLVSNIVCFSAGKIDISDDPAPDYSVGD